MPGLELFHRVSEPDSAEARRRVLALGLEGRVAFRNVEFPSHRDALAARGGGDTPALWDGARLHAGAAAVLAALAAAAAEERGAATRSAPLRPAPAALADAGGAPRLVPTSLHSADEPDLGPRGAYDRVADTRSGAAPARPHDRTYRICEEVCLGEGADRACMTYVPFARRFRGRPACLR